MCCNFLQFWSRKKCVFHRIEKSSFSSDWSYKMAARTITRIIQSLYYSPASRCINAWMHSLKKSVKPEIVNRYDLWVLRYKIGGAKVLTWIILRPLSALSLDEGLNALSGKNPPGCWLVQPTNQMSDISKYAH
jgi:hypothetical protein